MAESALRLLVIRRPSFQPLLDETPGVARGLLVTLSRRVRAAERALSSCRAFGGKDHTTVLHAVEKVEALIQKDPAFKKTLDPLTRGLTA